jgi:L-lactate dehydrogenase (cytochrome)
MDIKSARNIEDLQAISKKKLPNPIYHFIEGGADDELSLRRNMSAFDDYSLTPSHLTDVSEVDTKTIVLGHETSMPLILSPTGTSRLFHHQKEVALAKAGAKFGIPYALSAMAADN